MIERRSQSNELPKDFIAVQNQDEDDSEWWKSVVYSIGIMIVSWTVYLSVSAGVVCMIDMIRASAN